MKTMPATPQYDRLRFAGPVAVDREQRALLGYVVAQEGPFKSGRGQFTQGSLSRIVELGNASASGLKSRFSHPTESDDGLGKFLGRSKNYRIDGNRVRADLHLAEAAFSSPSGDLGSYVLQLAEEDPEALSSSLVLRSEKIVVLDERGKPKLDAEGNQIPPVWMPTKLYASDIVDTGDAVDGLLSAETIDGLPLSAIWRGDELLESILGGQPRQVAEARLTAWVQRWLDHRFGPAPNPAVRRKLQEMEARISGT